MPNCQLCFVKLKLNVKSETIIEIYYHMCKLCYKKELKQHYSKNLYHRWKKDQHVPTTKLVCKLQAHGNFPYFLFSQQAEAKRIIT